MVSPSPKPSLNFWWPSFFLATQNLITLPPFAAALPLLINDRSLRARNRNTAVRTLVEQSGLGLKWQVEEHFLVLWMNVVIHICKWGKRAFLVKMTASCFYDLLAKWNVWLCKNPSFGLMNWSFFRCRVFCPQWALSERFEVDGWVVKVSGQSRDILLKKCHRQRNAKQSSWLILT